VNPRRTHSPRKAKCPGCGALRLSCVTGSAGLLVSGRLGGRAPSRRCARPRGLRRHHRDHCTLPGSTAQPAPDDRLDPMRCNSSEQIQYTLWAPAARERSAPDRRDVGQRSTPPRLGLGLGLGLAKASGRRSQCRAARPQVRVPGTLVPGVYSPVPRCTVVTRRARDRRGATDHIRAPRNRNPRKPEPGPSRLSAGLSTVMEQARRTSRMPCRFNADLIAALCSLMHLRTLAISASGTRRGSPGFDSGDGGSQRMSTVSERCGQVSATATPAGPIPRGPMPGRCRTGQHGVGQFGHLALRAEQVRHRRRRATGAGTAGAALPPRTAGVSPALKIVPAGAVAGAHAGQPHGGEASGVARAPAPAWRSDRGQRRGHAGDRAGLQAQGNDSVTGSP
jgi:hypothetical protein